MADSLATSFGVLNYSGLLFNKGNTRTPFSTMIGGKAKVSNSVEFVVGQGYNGGSTGAQPEISENASLTAPDATVTTREQITNVTQIFQEAFGVSYGKMSNMGTLSGANIANQVANPVSEFDFQAAAKMEKIRGDMEYTFINGVYSKATSDATANKTRGMVNAISNEVKMANKALGLWGIADGMKAIYEANAPTDGLVLFCDATTMFQINADALSNGATIVPAAREINGIQLSSVITPLGVVYLYLGNYLPSGTALLMNMDVIAPVFQPVPEKGNFFVEELAKTGAGSKYQIFGQVGLDHGPEWYHCKFTGISTSFDSTTAAKAVKVTNTVTTKSST